MYPLAIIGRDMGPMLLRDLITSEVMEIEITDFQNIDDTKAGEDVDPSDGWSYLWTSPPIGTYQIRATAVTHGGLTMDSQSVEIRICDEPCQGQER